MRHLYIILISLPLTAFFIHNGYSQDLVQSYDGIKFIIHGNESMAPFNGGLDDARYQFVDIDGDNDYDLFTFDKDTTLYFYRNIGTPQNAKFQLVSQKYLGLDVKTWFYFTDIDHDNDYDLFAGWANQTCRYFKNTGSATNPQFTLTVNELRTNTDTTILTDQSCHTIFKDMDNDGDLDLFTGVSIGSIKYYENIGTPSAFNFKYITDVWEDILIISPADKPGSLLQTDDERHGANAFEFADVDNDNDFDLFFGDLFSKGIYYIRNDGTVSDPNMVIVDSNYPGNQPFESLGYNSVRLVDIDNDNDLDMFVSVLYASQTRDNFVLYKNNGTANNPLFQKTTDNYLVPVDVGSNSNMAIADLTGDGLPDMLVGATDQVVSFYKNTGTANLPQFTLQIDTLPLQYESFNYSPALADLDNDGDLDLIVGSYFLGKAKYYKNTGSQTNFNFVFQANLNSIGVDSLGQANTPALVDLDNDGDYDLFAGDNNGRIQYYENTGTASNFNFVFRTKFYAGIDVGDESVPRFYDIDGDNDYDLFIGKRDGYISYYKNEGTPSVPNFVLQTHTFKNINAGRNSCPQFVDIDNDTDPDLFVGNFKGGLYYYNNHDIIGIHTISNTVPEEFSLDQNYPNPFNPSTNIAFDIAKNGFVQLKIYDITGREVSTLVNQDLKPGSYSYSWNPENLSSGIYFSTLKTENFISTRKMTFLK